MKKTILIAICAALAVFLLASCSALFSKTEQSGTAPSSSPEDKSEPSGQTDTAEPVDPVTSDESDTAEPPESESETATETESESEEPAASETVLNGPPPIDYDVNAHLHSKRILIDAGHGFADPGCTSKYLNGVYERDICFEIAALLFEELEDRGYEPVMLRGTDTFPSAAEIEAAAIELDMFYREGELRDNYIFEAYERTLWANIIHRRDPVALMVSLHINALPDYEYIRGTELYYTVDNGCAEPSEKLAGFLAASIKGAFPEVRLKSEGCVWNDSYIVTKWTEMPSVLIEMAYSTNPDDAELLFEDEWREKYVDAIADAIEGYIKAR